jgi:DNA-binding NtrC family response regulator
VKPKLEQKRVLIVDDERTITDTLAVIFASAGYEARGVYSAEHARTILPIWSPHLAVIDVLLPNMNGIDLAILMRAEYPDCRLLLFSGQFQTADLLQAAAEEGHSFEILVKPVHPTKFLTWAAAQPNAENKKAVSTRIDPLSSDS